MLAEAWCGTRQNTSWHLVRAALVCIGLVYLETPPENDRKIERKVEKSREKGDKDDKDDKGII